MGPELWHDELANHTSAAYSNEEVYSRESSELVKVYLFFLFMFQTFFKVSDAAMNVLLKFFSLFICLVVRILKLDHLRVLKLPSSIYTARKTIKNANNRDDFKKYVCCPACHTIYLPEHCIINQPGHVQVSKNCTFVRFPLHPMESHRSPCETVLMKTIKTPSGKFNLYPKLTYCYQSIIQSIQDLLLGPQFFQLCESWRKCASEDGIFSDVYDGQVWKYFLFYEGQPFLDLPYNFALYLNIDWF